MTRIPDERDLVADSAAKLGPDRNAHTGDALRLQSPRPPDVLGLHAEDQLTGPPRQGRSVPIVADVECCGRLLPTMQVFDIDSAGHNVQSDQPRVMQDVLCAVLELEHR